MSDQYLSKSNLPLVEYNKECNQYNEGYRYVWSIQYGKSYVFKEPKAACWGSGVYQLNSDNTLGDCIDWNYDSSG